VQTLLAEQLAEIGVAQQINLHDELYVVEGDEKIRFNEFVPRNLHGATEVQPSSGIMKVKILSDGRRLQVREHPPLSFDFIDVQYEISTAKSSVTASVVAELVLSGFADTDLIIVDSTLSATPSIRRPGSSAPSDGNAPRQWRPSKSP
jgi:hypothetical protein